MTSLYYELLYLSVVNRCSLETGSIFRKLKGHFSSSSESCSLFVFVQKIVTFPSEYVSNNPVLSSL